MKSLQGRKILIVDDEPMLLNILSDEFAHYGAEVQTATSGQAAFELLQNSKVDAVITDARMPDGDGLWLLTQLKGLFTTLPKVFLCTGYNDIPAEKIAELGIACVFQKPFQLATLITTVSNDLG